MSSWPIGHGKNLNPFLQQFLGITQRGQTTNRSSRGFFIMNSPCLVRKATTDVLAGIGKFA